MLRARNKILLPLCLCLCLLLAACGRPAAEQGAKPTPTPAPWQPEAIPAIPGEESAPPETPADGLDGMEGSYYNDFLRETLLLDGAGECALTWPGGVMGGSYSRRDVGDVIIQLAELRLTVRVDAGGNLSIDGRPGRFLRDWDFWGITPAEAGIHPVNTLPDVEEIALGGGAYRYRDFGCGLALTYDEALRVAEDRLPDAVTVTDGRDGFVVGRNVTQRYLARGGSPEEFLADYLREDAFSDFAALYGAAESYDGLTMIKGEKDGRLAAGTLRISDGTREITARVLLYSSAFADGSEGFICKCVFAPAENADQLDALSAGVRDVGAARIVQLS